MGKVALPIAGGRHHAAAPSRSRHPSQLGGLEGPRRSSTHIQDDASTHRPRRVREYLLKIQREVTSICHHCQEEEDTAQHTLERRPAWEEPCRILRLTIGSRLAPEAIIEAMTRGQQELAAVRNYCEQVMLASASPKRTDTTPRDCGTTTTAVIEEHDEGAVRLRRVWVPPQTCTTAQGMRH
jgi:hypothetical protein